MISTTNWQLPLFLVFPKKEWESIPTVPNMKTERPYLLVAIVDHFVIALRGNNKSGSTVFMLKVLDIQQNSWNNGPTQMEHKHDSFVVGFSPKTNKIIITGGWANKNTLDTVEKICFKKCFFQTPLATTNKGQGFNSNS